MELSKRDLYRMGDSKNQNNIKDIVGKTVKPIAAKTREYTDGEGEIHQVLSIMIEGGAIYRTEVKAFIESFSNYWEVFADDEERPAIIITSKSSKRGNPYVNMEVAAE